MFVLVGFLILGWWFIWSLIRNIKGILALNENRPIANPTLLDVRLTAAAAATLAAA